MEIDEKLRHLSAEEMQRIISLYKDKSVKLGDIIEKYNIKVRPSGLLKILSPEITEQDCPYCNTSMFQKMDGRTTDVYRNGADKFCDVCGHVEYAEHYYQNKVCACSNCKMNIDTLIKEKYELIQRIYGKDNMKVKFGEIGFREQLDIIYLIKNNFNPKNEIEYRKLAVIKEEPFIIKVNRLREKGLIAISPNTEINAFEREDFPYTVNILEAVFKINVEFSEDDLEKINVDDMVLIENVSDNEKIDVLKEYIYDDAIEQFSRMLGERKLELVILDEANEKFKLLIEKISYTQLMRLCFNVARFYSDKVVTGDMRKASVRKAVLTSVNTFYENAIEKGWVLEHSKYEYAGDELKYYITTILHKKLELLRYVPSIENLKQTTDVEKDYANKKIHCKKE